MPLLRASLPVACHSPKTYSGPSSKSSRRTADPPLLAMSLRIPIERTAGPLICFAILRRPVNEGKTFLGRFSGKMPRCHWTAAISPQGRQRSSTHSPQPLQPQEPRGHTTSASGTHNFGSGDTQCRACASFAFIRIQRDTGFVKHSFVFRNKAIGRWTLPETGVSPPSLCPRSWRPSAVSPSARPSHQP